MKTSLNIQSTKEFIFSPTELELNIFFNAMIKGSDGQPAKGVRVVSTLTQRVEGGTLTECRELYFPLSFMSHIDSLDDNKEPSINPEALAQILAIFNLKIAPKVEVTNEDKTVN